MGLLSLRAGITRRATGYLPGGGRMMKPLAALIASAGLLFAAGSARADDLGDKISHGASAVGKTIATGAKAVGHGGAKVYHDVASGVNRDLADHADTRHVKAVHLKKAAH